MWAILILAIAYLFLLTLLGAFLWWGLGFLALLVFLGIVVFWIIAAVFFSESRIIQRFELVEGEFLWSGPFQRLLKMLGAKERIVVIKDPTPLIYCARSLGSRGTILVTNGLLGTLNEEEWVQSVQEALRFIRRKRHPFVTFLAFLSNRFSSQKPFASWYGWAYGQGESQTVKKLSPFGFLILLLWTPFFELCNSGLRLLNDDFKLPTHWPLRIKGIHPVALGPVSFQGIVLK